MRQRLWLVLVLNLLVAQPAAAGDGCDVQPKVCAKRAFDAGIEAFRRGDHSVARQHFERADQLTPHPVITFNLALAELHGEFYLEAVEHLLQVLDDDRTDPKLAVRARTELDLAEAKVATVRLMRRSGEIVSFEVDGVEIENPELVARVNPGWHWVKVTSGQSVTMDQSVKLSAGEQLRLALGADRSPNASSAAERPSASGLEPIWVYAGATLTLACVATTVWSGIDTLDAADEYERDLPNLSREQAQRRLDDGHDRERRTNLLIGASAALAAGTAALAVFWVDWDGDTELAIHPALGMLSLLRRF